MEGWKSCDALGMLHLQQNLNRSAVQPPGVRPGATCISATRHSRHHLGGLGVGHHTVHPAPVFSPDCPAFGVGQPAG